jgi:predicted TIM-barrel enzyme
VKKRFQREEILKRLRDTINTGRPILGAGCSAGIIAKCAEIGGANLIICYSTGISRIMGLRTQEIFHSNPQTLIMYDEISNVVKNTPIIAGIEANDQTVYDLDTLIQRFVDKGFDGVINFPTASPAEQSEYGRAQSASMARHLGIPWGFARELEMVSILRQRNVFTMCYVFSPEHAAQMVKAGVDIVCAHVGGTIGGLIPIGINDSIKAAQENTQRIIEAARKVDPNIICVAHGGAFSEPEDMKYLYEGTDAQGFVGASSIERIPVEKAVIGVCKALKDYKIRKM